MRLHALPAVGEGAVGGAEAGGGDAVGHRAERKGEVRVPLRRRDAKALQLRAQGADADRLRQIDRGDIQRAGERLAQRHFAVVIAAGVAGLIAAGKDARRVVDKAGGQIAVALDGGGVGRDRLDGAAGLPPDLRGAVQPQRTSYVRPPTMATISPFAVPPPPAPPARACRRRRGRGSWRRWRTVPPRPPAPACPAPCRWRSPR